MTTSATPGVWHKDGPLAQIDAMVRWVEVEADKPYANRETLRKVVVNLRAASAALSDHMTPSCEHDYDRWARPIGQAKIRRCRRCGRLQSWEEYLRRMRAARDEPRGRQVIPEQIDVVVCPECGCRTARPGEAHEVPGSRGRNDRDEVTDGVPCPGSPIVVRYCRDNG